MLTPEEPTKIFKSTLKCFMLVAHEWWNEDKKRPERPYLTLRGKVRVLRYHHGILCLKTLCRDFVIFLTKYFLLIHYLFNDKLTYKLSDIDKHKWNSLHNSKNNFSLVTNDHATQHPMGVHWEGRDLASLLRQNDNFLN